MENLINLSFNENYNQVVVSSLQVAEDFSKRHDKLVSEIERMYGGLTERECAQNGGDPLFYKNNYTHPQNKQQYPVYLMNRDGFSLLVMGFTGKDALEWKLKYIQAFNTMESELKRAKPISTEDALIQTLQLTKQIRLTAERAENIAVEAKQEIRDMRDIITLSSSNWRKGTSIIITKIAQMLGGNEYIQTLREESYKYLEERAHVALGIRLANKRKTMAENGVCKSKRDKLNKLDIISEDPKILEVYLAIVKEMAIKYGISIPDQAVMHVKTNTEVQA